MLFIPHQIKHKDFSYNLPLTIKLLYICVLFTQNIFFNHAKPGSNGPTSKHLHCHIAMGPPVNTYIVTLQFS